MLKFSADAPHAVATQVAPTAINFQSASFDIYPPYVRLRMGRKYRNRFFKTPPLARDYCTVSNIRDMQPKNSLGHAHEESNVMGSECSVYRQPRCITAGNNKFIVVVPIERDCRVRQCRVAENQHPAAPSKFIRKIARRFLRDGHRIG